MKPGSKPKIAVVGCGLIGQAWAVVFARAGHLVSLFDPGEGAAERAHGGIVRQLSMLAEQGLIEHSGLEAIAASISVNTTLADALAGAVYVQENGPERLEVKAVLTHEIDDLAGRQVPIGSSTSGIPASHYSAEVPGRSRCLVVHPINPPHLIPAVEVVPAPWTDEKVSRTVMALMAEVGQVPILLNREVEGFVVNRLQGALLAEAFRLVGSGVASAQDVDHAMSAGLGLRWALMGPFETIHLNAPQGVAQYVERYGPMYQDAFGTGHPNDDWASVVDDGLADAMTAKHALADIAAAQEVRDRALMALRKHLHAIAPKS